MPLKLKKDITLAGRPGTKGRLPDLGRFGCLGMTVTASVQKPWEAVIAELKQLAQEGLPEDGSLDMGFEYQPRGGAAQTVRIVAARAPTTLMELVHFPWSAKGQGATGASPLNQARDKTPRVPLTEVCMVVTRSTPAESLAFGYSSARHPDLWNSVIGYLTMKPVGHDTKWVGVDEWHPSKDAAGPSVLRAVLGSLGAGVRGPVEFQVNAMCWFQLPSVPFRPWTLDLPGVGAVEINRVSFTPIAQDFGVSIGFLREMGGAPLLSWGFGVSRWKSGSTRAFSKEPLRRLRTQPYPLPASHSHMTRYLPKRESLSVRAGRRGAPSVPRSPGAPPLPLGEFTGAVSALFEGVGKALGSTLATKVTPEEIAHFLTLLASQQRDGGLSSSVPTPAPHPDETLQQELNALRRDVKELRKQVSQLEGQAQLLRRIKEDVEGVSFDRAMARVWGKGWNPKSILRSKRPAAPGLGLSEQEWAAVLQEA